MSKVAGVGEATGDGELELDFRLKILSRANAPNKKLKNHMVRKSSSALILQKPVKMP
jgi:hypothetical protein